MTEIRLAPADVVQAGTYNFSIFVSTSPTECNWKGEYTFPHDTTAVQAAHLIARHCVDGDEEAGKPHSVMWLFLDQNGPDWLYLNMGEAL